MAKHWYRSYRERYEAYHHPQVDTATFLFSLAVAAAPFMLLGTLLLLIWIGK